MNFISPAPRRRVCSGGVLLEGLGHWRNGIYRKSPRGSPRREGFPGPLPHEEKERSKVVEGPCHREGDGRLQRHGVVERGREGCGLRVSPGRDNKGHEEETYFEVNGRGTDNLIHACLESGRSPQRFIYLSSQAAAGPGRNGCGKKESDTCERFLPTAGASAWGKSLHSLIPMSCPLSFSGLPRCMAERKGYLFLFQTRFKEDETVFHRGEPPFKPCLCGRCGSGAPAGIAGR